MLLFDPRASWHWIATTLATVAILLLAVTLITSRRFAFGRRRGSQGLGALFSLLAVALLAFAAWNPLLVRSQDPNRLHLSVVLDLSPSVLRVQGGWAGVRTAVSQLIAEGVTALSEDLRSQGSASIIVFRNQEIVIPVASLDALADRITQVKDDQVSGDGSNLAAGLERAGAQIASAGGRGVVVLVSDGLQTEGDAEAAASDLARRGIPVLVYPLESLGAELTLISADLPRQAHAGEDTLLRGVLWNTRREPAAASLMVALNQGFIGTSPRVSSEVRIAAPVAIHLDAEKWARLRTAMAFDGYGLQFADVNLSFDAGQGVQYRRFFTHVKRPLKLLAIGGDQGWTGVFADGSAQITESTPGSIAAAGDLLAYDGIVISAVTAESFAPGELRTIATAVEQGGVGLMLLNGDHAGNSPEAATVLKSYDDTPIAPLLPVKSGPRPFEDQPPTRHVVFLIDASGSMEGWKFAKAKQIVASIIDRELRPVDKVDIIGFTAGAQYLLKDQLMTDQGKSRALQALATLQIGGGTDPTQALGLLAGRQLEECGLIFLSDGEFGAVTLRPDCRTTAFAVGGYAGSVTALNAFADPFQVDESFDPEAITIPYFAPQKRTKHWEIGEFAPLSTAAISRTVVDLPVPDLPLDGSAISHALPDADVIAQRPKLTDPILAYRQSGLGYVGVLTTRIPDAWLGREGASSAVKEWMSQIAPYAARDRYDFDLQDDGKQISMRIALVQSEQGLPDVKNLSLQIERAEHEPQSLPVQIDTTAPATFATRIELPRGEHTEEVTLVVREVGPDALARPQRIPLLVPPAGAVTPPLTDEAYSFGTNLTLLDRIAELGGGRRLNPLVTEPLLAASPPRPESRALWPWLLVAAAVLYLSAISIRRSGL